MPFGEWGTLNGMAALQRGPDDSEVVPTMQMRHCRPQNGLARGYDEAFTKGYRLFLDRD